MVEFWVPFLEQGLSSVLSVPFLLLRDLYINIAFDTWSILSPYIKPLLKKEEKEKVAEEKGTLKRRRSAPANKLKEMKVHTRSEVSIRRSIALCRLVALCRLSASSVWIKLARMDIRMASTNGPTNLKMVNC